MIEVAVKKVSRAHTPPNTMLGVTKTPRKFLVLILYASSLCILATGCMTSFTAMNRAEGRYTWETFSEKELPPLKPNGAYYALLPLTIPFDIGTAPIQLPILICIWGYQSKPATNSVASTP